MLAVESPTFSGGSLVAIDLASGARTALGPLTGAAEDARPFALSLAGRIGFFLDLERTRPQVLAIDVDSLEVEVVARNLQGAGPSLRWPVSMAADGGRLVVADLWGDRLGAIDLASGDRTVLSGVGIGDGPELNPKAVAVVGDRAFVATFDEVFAIDLFSGDRAIVSGPGVGTGPAFGNLRGIAVDGDVAFVSDPAIVNRYVLAVDLDTGVRKLFADETTTGIAGFSPRRVRIAGERAFFTKQSDALVSAELQNGSASVVSGLGVSGGPALSDLDDFVLDGERALVAMDHTLLAIDLATGDRTVIADLGADVVDVSSMAISGEWLFFADTNLGLVYALDLVTGERVILSVTG